MTLTESCIMTWNGSVLTFEIKNDVALIGLNRPEKRNAISDALLEEIRQANDLAQGQAKAVVVFGHGNHFSAGLDLGEHVRKNQLDAFRGSRRWHDVFSQIQFGTIPWISALHGAVIGGGLELAAATHIRVADETAFFALPEGQRGIFVGGGASVRAARLMGASRMADMMLTGRVISAPEAERWGIVQYLADGMDAKTKAIEIAERTTENAEISNLGVLQALPRIQDMSIHDGLFTEALMSSFASSSDEANARLTAFLEKRSQPLDRPAGKE